MTLPAEMTAIAIRAPGGPEMLVPVRLPVPRPGSGEVLIKVAAAGVNRGDMYQREGHYPPPPGAPDTPGLEVAGEIVAVGADVARWAVGDRVCAIVPGGGYAEFCLAAAGSALPIPPGLSMIEAASVPETALTVWANLFEDRTLRPGETLLLHGGASGIGTMGIQMAKAYGARVLTTAGSDEKCAACEELGADAAINYRTRDFVEEVMRLTGGRGADVILDMVAGDYIPRNLAAAAPRGRIVWIGLLNGFEHSIDLRPVLVKRLVLTGSTLRGRSDAEKAALAATAEAELWPRIAKGEIKTVIDQVFPLADAAASHVHMSKGIHMGKIILTP
jgi:NADPH2:quinone reductase